MDCVFEVGFDESINCSEHSELIYQILVCFIKYRNLEDYCSFMHHVVQLHLSVLSSSASLVTAYAQSLIPLLKKYLQAVPNQPPSAASAQSPVVITLQSQTVTISPAGFQSASQELHRLVLLSYQYQYRNLLTVILTYYATEDPPSYLDTISILMSCIASTNRLTKTHLDCISHLMNWIEHQMLSWRSNGSIIRISSVFHVTVSILPSL